MSFASSSTSAASALRSTVRPRRIATTATQLPVRRSRIPESVSPTPRRYSPAPALLDTDEASFSRSTSTSTTTPSSAQAYLSDLLRLPSSRAFPEPLALQILTHKSYRFVHLIRHHPPPASLESDPTDMPSPELQEWAANHNARLTFLGRRALAGYLAMFVHSSIPTSAELRELDFLRGRSLEEKLEAMRMVQNVGREVGTTWGVRDVMRWDRNETGEASAAAKIKGMTVEAILGGVFTQFGSPAAHRTFHLHILPHLRRQLRDPRLIERVESMRDRLVEEYGGGILPP